MTLQQLLQPIAVPSRPQGFVANGSAAFSAVGVIDANDEKVAFVVLLQKAGDISTVHFRTGTVTTGDDVLVRLETVDQTTGDPTGTLWGTTTSATVTVADGDDDTWMVATLTTDATIASGDVGKPIAIVIAAPAAGFIGSMEIDQVGGGYFISGRTDYDNASWVKEYTGSWSDDGYLYNEAAAIRLGYDDGSFAYIQNSYAGDENPSSVTFDVDSTPDEIGIKIRFPYSFQACGVWLSSTYIRDDTAVKVYNDSDVEQMTLPNWYRGWSARDVNYKGVAFVYGDTFTVLADTWYRITWQPTTSDGSSLRAYYIPQATDAHWACWGLDQADYKWTERTDAGSWTDRDDRLLFGGFMADQFHDGAGGGGGGGTKLIGSGGGMIG
jgi:hypothetical protein